MLFGEIEFIQNYTLITLNFSVEVHFLLQPVTGK